MPSFNALGTALLACAGSAVATQFTLADTYDYTNFFDKFTFSDAADTNSGFVVYQNKANAQAQGLAKITSNNEVFLGVDSTTVLKGSGYAGRNSFRIESTASYQHGLIVARFTHLPANKCGSWPSFWTVGESWPNDGEIDVYEGWNNIVQNQPAFHVGSSKSYGQCTLDNTNQTAPVATSNCDNTFQSPPSQYLNQGCTANDANGPWASSSGGTYAIEWTSDYIKLYNWARGAEPANLASSNPDTATWGTPAVNLQNSNCNIDKHFNNQRLVFDIDFCGNPVGTPAYWLQSCSMATGQATCADYVARFPGDFSETFFQIQDIRYFSQSTSKPVTSSKLVTSSKAATSSKPAASSKPATSSKAAASVVASSAAASSAAASSVPQSSVAVPTSVIASQPPAVTTSQWSNSSVAATSSAKLTTSTVYTTRVHTVSQCGPEVTNCPFRPSVTTDTIAVYTTVCPVEEAESSSLVAAESSSLAAAKSSSLAAAAATTTAAPAGGNGVPSGPETLTTDITIIHTITSCAADVTNCPARHSTQVIPVPVQPTGVAPPVAPVAPAPSAPVVPVVPVAPAPSNAPGGVAPPPPVAPAPSYPIAPAPSASVVPVVPVAPVAPAPSAPVPPVAPVAPAPSAPVVPVAPVAPAPSAPVAPVAPVSPAVPIAPPPVAPGNGNGTWSTQIAGPTAQPPAPSSGAGCSGADCLPPLGSGAVRTGMSTLALVGAMAVMLL
ncbi:glycoside hydrolase family 16 protein [Trichoderma chlorosporum]